MRTRLFRLGGVVRGGGGTRRDPGEKGGGGGNVNWGRRVMRFWQRPWLFAIRGIPRWNGESGVRWGEEKAWHFGE